MLVSKKEIYGLFNRSRLDITDGYRKRLPKYNFSMSCFVTRAAISGCFDLFRGRVFFLCSSLRSVIVIVLYSRYFFLHKSVKIFRHKQIFSLKKTQKSKRPYFLLFAVIFFLFLFSNPNNFNNLQQIYLRYEYSL